MVYCAVVGCSNNNNNNNKKQELLGLPFFRFPRNKQVCEQWILKCYQQHKFNVKTSRICSKHFAESDYRLKEKLLELPQNKWKLKSDAEPSLLLLKSPSIQTSVQLKRTIRMTKRRNKKLIKEFQQEPEISNVEARTEISNVEVETRGEKEEEKEILPEKSKNVSTSTQTTSEIDCVEQVKILQSENLYLKTLLHKEREEKKTIEQIFTEGELRKLKTAKQVQWSVGDIASAISLYAGGSRSYRLLRKRGYHLPSISTLRR